MFCPLKLQAIYVSSDIEGLRGQIYGNIFENHNQYLYLKYLTSWNYHHPVVFLRSSDSLPLPFVTFYIVCSLDFGADYALSCLFSRCQNDHWHLKRLKRHDVPSTGVLLFTEIDFFLDAVCYSVWFLCMWEAVEMSICLQYILVAAVLVCGSCPWFTTLHFHLLIRLVTYKNASLQKLSFPFSSPWKHAQWFHFHPQFSNSTFFPSKFLKNRSGRILLKASGKGHFDGD